MVDYAKALREAQAIQQGGTPTGGVSSLLDDDKFNILAQYMQDRAGMSERDYSREEIRDAYVNIMRGFNVGNSVDVVQEMSYLYRGEGEELTNRRQTANQAYELWDSLDGAFAEGTTIGEKADAVGDYAKSIVLDPVNVVSLGIGKLAAAGSTRAATQGLKVLAQQAGRTAVKEATKRGLTQAAAKQEGRIAARRALQQSMLSREGQELIRRGGIADIIATGATDTAVGVVTDAGIQKANVMVGRSEGYNPTQGALAAAGGALGAGMAGAMVALRGTSGIVNTTDAFVRSNETLDAAAKRLTKNGKIDPKAVNEALDVKKAQEALDEWLTPFNEFVEQGRFIDEAGDGAAEVYEPAEMTAFFKGLDSIFEAAGIPIDRLLASSGQRRTGWYIDTITDPSFPNEIYDKLQDSVDSIVAKVPGAPRVELEDYLKLGAVKVSEGAQLMQAMSTTSRITKQSGKAANKVKGEEALGAALGDAPVDEVVKEGIISRMQHAYIRMLVTNPATTALNVLGWGQASALQSMSDTLRGTLYGGTAILNGLVGRKESYSKFARKAQHMYSLQKQKFRNLADPMGTQDEVLDYLTYRPNAQDALFRYLAGGVESEDVMKELNLLPGETLTKSGLKKAFDGLQVAYGVSAQDMLTKTQEFAYALDKNIRLKYGMSWGEFMGQDDIANILMDPKKSSYQDYLKVEASAVESALGTVYARKFGPKPGERPTLLKFVAGTIEDMRNVPVLGALVPFGQFFNNTIAFMYDYTGANLVISPFTKGFKNIEDPMELLTKAAVGWSAFAWATNQETKNLEDGLAWHESRGSDGQVITRIYDYPLSFWKMAGRIGAHIQRDGEVPLGLFEEFQQKFAGQDVFRNLGEAAGGVQAAIQSFTSGDTGDGLKAVGQALSASAGMYVSGFTRFADPVNTALAFAEGENYIEPTRNVGNRNLNNALRYTDRIFDQIIGLENIPGTEGYRVEKQSATTSRDTGASLERVFGVRSVAPTTNVQRLFNDVGRPQWQTDIRVGDPMAQNIINEYIFPYLEIRAIEMFESGNWDTLSLKDKNEALKKLIGFAKEDVKSMLAGQAEGSDLSKAELIYSINGLRSSGRKNFDDTLESFGVSEDELFTLGEQQLELLQWFIKENASNQRDFIDTVLGEE